MARIAYLGPEGTFTEAALLQMADRGMIPRPGAIEPLAADGPALSLKSPRDDLRCFLYGFPSVCARITASSPSWLQANVDLAGAQGRDRATGQSP